MKQRIKRIRTYLYKIDKKKKLFITFTCLLLLLSVHSTAQSFVYTPKNPAFGGNSFNYQWMMSSAQAQDTYKDPKAAADKFGYTQDPAKDFADNLNRQILSRLSREIINRQFGESAIEEGTYLLGDYQIEVGSGADGISVSIVDIVNGSTTTVTIPHF